MTQFVHRNIITVLLRFKNEKRICRPDHFVLLFCSAGRTILSYYSVLADDVVSGYIMGIQWEIIATLQVSNMQRAYHDPPCTANVRIMFQKISRQSGQFMCCCATQWRQVSYSRSYADSHDSMLLSSHHRVLKKFSQTKAADVRRVIVGSVLGLGQF